MNNNNYYSQSVVPFIGVIEDIVDKTFVRVRCFGVHPIDKSKVRTDQLPPAQVIYPVTGGQTTSGNLAHNLEIDSWVMGYFMDYPMCQNLIVTGVIQGADYSMSLYKYQGGEFVEQGSSFDLPDEEPDVDTTSTINIPGGSNRQKSYNYVYAKLRDEGSSDDLHLHTSALMGVLLLETSNINPRSINSIGAYGICQWLGSRREQLFDRYGKTKRLDQQLDFMWWELNNTERRAKGLWLRSQNMPDAVAGFAAFERAEEYQNGRINRMHSNYQKRLQYAYEIYNSIEYTGS